MFCSKRFFTLKSGCKSDSARVPVVILRLGKFQISFVQFTSQNII